VLHTVARVRQRVHAVMARGHPLEAMSLLRLGDCIRFPVGLPTHSHGVRQLIDLALANNREPPFVVIESDSFDFLRNYQSVDDVITFQMAIGLPAEATDQMTHRPIDERDLRPADVFLGHLRDRTLPPSAASFLEQVGEALGKLQ
jgi:DNA-binding transcriptional LysR family regulator